MIRSVVFFDTHVEQYRALGDSLPAGTDRVVLDHRSDGIEQIAAHLRGRTGIEAIHVVSHGSPGALCLGNAVVSSASLAGHGPWLRAIGQSLAPGGDILLYGCNVAAGDAGRSFVASLAAITGANIAASAEATGASTLGGDAALEFRAGEASTPGLFSQRAFDEHGVLLALTPPSVTPGVGTWNTTNPFGDHTFTGSITSASEVDLYRFFPNVNGNFVFTVPAGALDAEFRVYNSSGVAVTTSIDRFTAAGSETTTLTLGPGGPIYIAVSGSNTNSTGAYSLQINGPDSIATSIATPAPSFAGSLSGPIAQLGYGGDLDYVRLVAPAGTSTLDLRVDPLGIDSFVRLWDGSGNWLQDVGPGLNGVNTADLATGIPIIAGNTYFASISSQNLTSTGSYVVSADFNPDEPAGDPPATVTPLTGSLLRLNPNGDVSRSGSIDSRPEVDLYAFHVEQVGNHVITVSGALDAQLRVYDKNGAALTGSIDLSFGGESTTLNFGQQDWVYVAVGGFESQTGSYTLSVNGPDAFAASISTPAPVFTGSNNGGIDIGGDVDYWMLTAPAGTNSLNLSVAPSAALDTLIELYDSTGALLQTIDSPSVGSQGAGVTDTATGIAVTAGGNFFVGVSSNSRTSTGNYTVSADFNPDQDFGDPPATITPNSGTVLRLNPFGDVTRSGNVTPAGEFTPPFSLYQFHVESPGNHVISVSGTLDTQLRVYDSSGAALTGIIDGPGAGGTESTTLNLGSTGWVYVAVGGFQNQTGPFTLTVNGPDYDTVAIPTPALAFIGSNGGSIGEAGDVDYWSITAPAGTNSLDLSVVPSTALDTLIELYDSTGALLQTIDSPSAGSQGAGVTDTATGIAVTAGGNFFVGVSSNSRTSTGNYTVSADFNPDQADTTAPTVQTFSPADEATGVSQGSNIVVTFSEDIQRGTGTIVLRNAAGVAVETYQAATAAQVSISGSAMTLDPSADLASGAGYRVDFDFGSVKDLAGNPYTGTTAYNFTTSTAPDTTPPTVASVSPSDGSTGVAVGSNIVLLFSESIERGSGSIVLKTAAGAVVETFDAGSSANLSISGSALTINPTADLSFGAQYRVELAAGTLKDGSGNSYGGNASGYSFSTLTQSGLNLIGTPGPDVRTGGAGDDRIEGLGGNDRMTGGGGNDVIDGGPGIDTAVYAGSRAGFTVTRDGQGKSFTIADNSGAEGTDLLKGMEKIEFGDKTFDLVNPPRTGVPEPLVEPSFLFDGAYYLLSNPELVPTVTMSTAFQHYYSTGAAQGMDPNSWFDPNYYESRWPDLRPLNWTDQQLFVHYNTNGVWEGRSAAPEFDKFDGERYLNDWADVEVMVDSIIDYFLGSRTNGAIAHFIIYGNDEQRPAFDLFGQQIDLGYTI